MKYLYWLTVLGLVVIRRILGPFMIWSALVFRKYLRNVVYNYHLQNEIYLKRLYERNPTQTPEGYILDGGAHSSCVGLVEYRKITRIEYYFALSLWLWLDDDSNQDTYDKNYNSTIIQRKRFVWLPKFIVNKLIGANRKANRVDNIFYGNSFDLGDIRATRPLFEFWSVLLWAMRNTAYNFNYKFHEISNDKLVFRFIVFGRLFGYDSNGYLTIDNQIVKFYSWECGKRV